MKHIQTKQAGYDCMHSPCKHTPKGHGISGGYYRWTVVADAGDLALTLTIHADDYPETIPTTKRARMIARDAEEICTGHGPNGSAAICSLFPVNQEQVLHGPRGDECIYLLGRCYVAWESYTETEKFASVLTLDARGVPTFTQETPFWNALEARLSSLAMEIRAERADTKFMVCPTCGQGTIEKKETP